MVKVVQSVFISPGRQRSSVLEDVQTVATNSLDRNALGVLMPGFRESDYVEIMRLDNKTRYQLQDGRRFILGFTGFTWLFYGLLII